jgi:purine-binding chemotaxis protein CheW
MTKLNQADDEGMRLVVFSIERQRYALHLSAVDRALRAVQVTPLPNAPAIVLGVINVEGRVVPVVNIRARFGLDEREMRLSDALILARTPKRTVALSADAVEGLLERPTRQIQDAASIFPELPYLQGVAKLDDGLVLIHDLASFLSLDEERELDVAMTNATPTRQP